MLNTRKTNRELINEVSSLRARVSELEKLTADRTNTKEALQRERDFISAVLDTVGALVLVLDAEGRIVRFNRACEQLTGYSFAEVEGAFFWNLFLIPEELEHVKSVFAQLQAGQSPNAYENVWKTKAGEQSLIAWSNTALFDDSGSVEYIVATGIDVTARRRAEMQVRQLSRAVEQSPSTVVITDVEGNIEYANPKFTEITGYAFDEVIAQNPRLLKSGVVAPEVFDDLWATITAGKEWRGEFLNRKKNGDLYWELASISPIRDEGGRITHFLKVGEDITERKQAEEALDAFAHTVAHDLRNPLNLVIGYADVLEQDWSALDQEAQRKYLHAIARNGRKMSEIIEALLLLAGVRKMSVPMSPLHMSGIVADAVARLADVIDRHDAEIVLPDTWPVVLGYGPWVEEVWANYLSNAIVYGGRRPRVELGTNADEAGMIRFWVRDNGSGIPSERLPDLFKPFTQLDRVHAGGHGLGLSIVRHIVEKLGGQVDVESEMGAGSVFSFTLPGAPEEG
jgi:PAS domain S-box-containing protein